MQKAKDSGGLLDSSPLDLQGLQVRGITHAINVTSSFFSMFQMITKEKETELKFYYHSRKIELVNTPIIYF